MTLFQRGKFVKKISKQQFCETLNLPNPDKLELNDLDECLIFVDYEGKPYCELRKVDKND